MRLVESRWVVQEIPEPARTNEIPALAGRLGVPDLVARLLWLRDARTVEAGRSFLSPRLQDLASPGVLPDIAPAAQRLAHAVRKEERVAIFGDYDVDGMTGTALLVRFLELAGADVIWGIPDRQGDGYGLGVGAVDSLAARGAQVIVTVDNGIGAHPAAERAADLGLDLVITDHHLPGDTLPPAVAVVNPQRLDASGAGRDLCGCGLAFKLAWAVAERLRDQSSDPGTAAAFKAFLRDAVGLVALATISDVVPLREENRILVSAGLAALRASEHPGIRALLETSRLGELPLTTEDVAFRIAPRLNAAGRLSRPELVVNLLTSHDGHEAHRFARQLADANAERRKIERGVLDQARVHADALLQDDATRRSLVVHGEGWHLGVIGIVAARLVDLHHRPTVVIGFDGAGGRGSCRTPREVNLHSALQDCGSHLSRYGGHAAAAGLEIDRRHVTTFADAFESAVRDQVGSSLPRRTLQIDAEATIDDWSLEAVEALSRLGPFGAGNPQPMFLVRGASVAGRARRMGQDGQHLSFALKQAQGAIRVVAFRKAAFHETVSSGEKLDVVVTPSVNAWRGMRTAELQLVDLRPTASVRTPAGAKDPF